MKPPVKQGGTPKVPDGTVITQWVTDDTLPGGPRTVERTYIAPFARANREEDYRIAWAFFDGQGCLGSELSLISSSFRKTVSKGDEAKKVP